MEIFVKDFIILKKLSFLELGLLIELRGYNLFCRGKSLFCCKLWCMAPLTSIYKNEGTPPFLSLTLCSANAP